MAHHSGIGTYIRNLVPRVAALEPAWRFTLIGERDRLATEPWARFPSEWASCRAPIYGIREQVEVAAITPRTADILWTPHYNIPLLSRTRLFVTVHDLAHLRLPEFRAHVARRLYAETLFRGVRRRAEGIAFDSDFTRTEFHGLVGTPRGRAEVIHCGVDEAWFEAPEETPPLDGPYFVFVGNLKPNKNVRLILQALERTAVGTQRLVIIGRVDGLRTDDRDALRMVGELGSRVTVTGELEEPELRRYVRHATALVLPSRYEGFGLPPLEAMAAGTPALVARSASLPEVCGDAALYFDADDADTLATAMRRVITDEQLRAELRRRGRERARGFRWERTADETRSLLRHALET